MVDNNPRRARALKKGEGWAALAACPHCGFPVRFFIQARRAVCLVSVEHSAFLGRVEAVPGQAAAADCDAVGQGILTLDAEGVESDASATTGTGAVTAASDIGAPSVVHPGERGFDDDEAPFPT